MNKCRPSPGANRREFLRDGLRLAVLGGLAAIAGKLTGRSAARPSGQVCISAGICRGCAVFEGCGLPRALSAKEVLSHPPSRHL